MVVKEGKARHFLHFEDVELQAALMRELEAVDANWVVESDGSITFDPAGAPAVMRAVHRVRDGCFQWYGLRCPDPIRAERFRRLLEEKELAFVVEHADSGTWFIVPRADEVEHEDLFSRA